ncbi:MAG: cell wall-binding repeat-containing protein [Acidimicrobiales bacterium]
MGALDAEDGPDPAKDRKGRLDMDASNNGKVGHEVSRHGGRGPGRVTKTLMGAALLTGPVALAGVPAMATTTASSGSGTTVCSQYANDPPGGPSGADRAACSYVEQNYPGAGQAQVLSTQADTDRGKPVYDVKVKAPTGVIYVVHVVRGTTPADSTMYANQAENQSSAGSSADASPDSSAGPDTNSPDASPDQKAGPDNSPDSTTGADAKSPDTSTSAPSRLEGSTRQGTAFAVARAAYPNGVASQTAVLVAGDDSHLVDALTAAPLAKSLAAPILLTKGAESLGSAMASELSVLGVTKVVLVGAVANPAIQSQLPTGVTVSAEYAGASRYDTAAQVADALQQQTGSSSFPQVFVASGNQANLADALSAAPAAAMAGAPLLLAPPAVGWSITMPASEAPFTGAAHTLVQVGVLAPDNVSNAGSSDTIERLGGATRYSTSDAIDAKFFPGASSVLVANGVPTHLVDALSAGPYAAEIQAPVLLTAGGVVGTEGSHYLASLPPSVSFTDLGGTDSIPSQNGS